MALVVDDSAAMRHHLRKALENLGWQVRDVESGAEALMDSSAHGLMEGGRINGCTFARFEPPRLPETAACTVALIDAKQPVDGVHWLTGGV